MTADTQQTIMIPGFYEAEIRLIYGCWICNAAESAVTEECGCMITVCLPYLETCIFHKCHIGTELQTEYIQTT